MRKLITVISLVFAVSVLTGVLAALASDTTEFSQSITGSLDVQIVDASGNTVTSPGVAFPSKAFSMTYQASAATLGTSSERMRITNPSGTTDTWTLNIAATSGATAAWSNGTNYYDYNDSTASAGDGVDTDSYGGQMTIDPSVGTIAGVGGTATTNVSKGTSDAFVEGSVSSIDLMTAAAGAPKPGQWDLTGTSLSQTIPGAQTTGSYTLNMTLTAT
ncbi:MAG: hypothetical protein AAB487_01230 [Patescibacteria group bacterium]